MYHTGFFQKRLAEALNSDLIGLQLLACFSQQKDELILSFGDPDRKFHISADMSSRAGILSFRESFARARKKSVDLFDKLLDRRVVFVRASTHERSFTIQLEGDFQLVFKMNGNRSNILLIENGRVIKIFRNNLLADRQLNPEKLHNLENITDSTILKLLGKKNILLFDSSENDASSFLDQLDSNSIYIGLKGDQPYLSLVKTENPILVTNDAIEASNRFTDLHHRHFQLAKEKQKIRQEAGKQIKQAENYIGKTSHKLDEITNQRNLEELADILMANLHSLSANKTEVTLDDFYTNSPITIKLTPKLSPQKNAENYYRKSKNKKIELRKLEENISSKQRELKRLQTLLDDLAETDNLKELRTFNTPNFGKANKQKAAPLPYHKFAMEGCDVLVGNHARSNDILTQKVAKANDLWLHTKDVQDLMRSSAKNWEANFQHL